MKKSRMLAPWQAIAAKDSIALLASKLAPRTRNSPVTVPKWGPEKCGAALSPGGRVS
jgi:hypothetical protein